MGQGLEMKGSDLRGLCMEEMCAGGETGRSKVDNVVHSDFQEAEVGGMLCGSEVHVPLVHLQALLVGQLGESLSGQGEEVVLKIHHEHRQRVCRQDK